MVQLVSAVVLTFVFCASAWATPPTETLREVFAQADKILTDPRPDYRPHDRLVALRKLLSSMFDYPGTAELVFGKRWPSATPTEQEEFTRLFGELVERSYIARMSQVTIDGGVKVRYLDESVDDHTAIVRTAVARRSGGELLLNYRMVERDGRWLVRDVIVDGVSGAANYRAQLDRVLDASSVPEMLTQLRAKVDGIEPTTPPPSLGDGPPFGQTSTVADVSPPPRSVSFSEASPLARPVSISDAALPLPVADTPHDARAVASSPAPTMPVAKASPVVSSPAPSVPVAKASPVISSPAPIMPVAPATPVARLVVSSPAPTMPAADALPADRPIASSPAPIMRVTEAARPVAMAAVSLPTRSAHAATMDAPAPSVAPRTTKAYWLQIETVETAEAAGRLTTRLREGRFPVALEHTNTAGKPLLTVRVGPFRDAAEAVFALLELQTKGHDPSLVAERE